MVPTPPGKPPRPIQRIYLTGFMGAGKSTVGALLAARLAWRFRDLDAVIEERAGRRVADIFAEQGETHFRLLEAEHLRELQSEQRAIVSLGGGAIETADVRALLSGDPAGRMVFLEAPLARLLERCEAQDGADVRPLLRDPARLEARYENRLIHYRKAHLTIATEALNPEQVAAAICQGLQLEP